MSAAGISETLPIRQAANIRLTKPAIKITRVMFEERLNLKDISDKEKKKGAIKDIAIAIKLLKLPSLSIIINVMPNSTIQIVIQVILSGFSFKMIHPKIAVIRGRVLNIKDASAIVTMVREYIYMPKLRPRLTAENQPQ